MPRLKIFLSYSHRDGAVKKALLHVLGEAGFEVRTNTDKSNTSDLHRGISINLNWSDVVIPIITTNWLNSQECRDETLRAHERRKEIVAFREQGVTDDGPPAVPWYLRGNLILYVVWQDDDVQLGRAIDDLVRRLKDEYRPDSWQSRSYKDIRELGDLVQKSQHSHHWQTTLATRILETARGQLSKVLASTDCVLSISHEHSYLRFAQPIFSEAKTIIAICIARISTFWISPDNTIAVDAGNYLNEQREADSICRLFVFESVAELMKFRPILEKHRNSYGKETNANGVFICSSVSYRHLLDRWGVEPDEKALRQDFGILSFEDQTSKGMYATLNNRDFRYTMYDESHQDYARNRRVIDHFAKLRQLTEGEFDTPSGVARWSPKWADSHEEFADSLERIFKEKRQSVTHVVLLRPKNDCPTLFHHLQRLATHFHNEREALKINAVSMKRRCDVAVADGRYASPLLVWQDFDYFLIVEFDDPEALKHYYQHELHSVEREKLYLLLNPDMESRFQEARNSGAVHAKAAIFAEIESTMTSGGYIRRIDVRSDDPLIFLLHRMN
jgi:hypothetical protein